MQCMWNVDPIAVHVLVAVQNPLRYSSKQFPHLSWYLIGGARNLHSIVPIASSMPCIMSKTRVLMNNGVEVFWQVCCVSAVCMDRYALSTRLLSWFLLSYDSSFAREWINTLLNIPALISVPDHLRLFSLPVLIDASGVQKRRYVRLSLTPEIGWGVKLNISIPSAS
jgi:hypothetical protein